MSENIIADEQNNTNDDSATTTEAEVANDANEDVVSKAEYDKLQAEKEKREGRYKSTMKKNTVVTNEPKKDSPNNGAIDVESIVEQKLAKIKEEEAFIRAHGEAALNDELRDVMAKHPSLSYEQALKLTSVGQDPAINADATQTTMVGQPIDANRHKNQITEAELYSLNDSAYADMMEKVESGTITVVE